MLTWFAETTVITAILAAVALLGGRWRRTGPVGRHALWLVVLVKFVTPPIISWPWPAIVLSDEVREPERPGRSTGPVAVRAEWMSIVQDEVRDAAASLVPAEAPAPVPRLDLEAGPGFIPTSLDLAAARRALLIVWAGATSAIVLACGFRVARFRRHLRGALAPPRWFEQEARKVAQSLGVRVPEILVIPATTTPMLWCLGRPRLLLPGRLVESLRAESWRGILAHELAHLRRRDHWVRRLELVAGLFWWWNPLYWLALARIEAEAELACDECAVRAFPEGRLAYAEALLKVCESLSPAVRPAPALGAVGSGRFLERRVTMILRDPAPSPRSAPVLIGAALLSLVAIPGWSAPGPADRNTPDSPAVASQPVRIDVVLQDDDKRDRDADARAQRRERTRARTETERRSSRSADAEATDDERAEKAREAAREGERIGREMKETFGPDSEFQKGMKALGEQIAKNFGPDSEFAKGLEKSFGPDSEFQKQMQEFGKEIKKKFGPDSDFAKEMEKKFGPGSDFAKEMEKKFGPDSDFAKEMEKKFGPDSDFAKKLERKFGAKGDSDKSDKELKLDRKVEKKRDRADEADNETPRGKTATRPRTPATTTQSDAARRSRARQIDELQKEVERLSQRLRALQEEEKNDEGKDEDRGRRR